MVSLPLPRMYSSATRSRGYTTKVRLDVLLSHRVMERRRLDLIASIPALSKLHTTAATRHGSEWRCLLGTRARPIDACSHVAVRGAPSSPFSIGVDGSRATRRRQGCYTFPSTSRVRARD